MARAFGFSTARKVRYIYAPAALESYAAAVKTSMGLAWKAGVAAEVLAGTEKTLGGEIYSTKIYLEVPRLFAWTVAVCETVKTGKDSETGNAGEPEGGAAYELQ